MYKSLNLQTILSTFKNLRPSTLPQNQPTVINILCSFFHLSQSLDEKAIWNWTRNRASCFVFKYVLRFHPAPLSLVRHSNNIVFHRGSTLTPLSLEPQDHDVLDCCWLCCSCRHLSHTAKARGNCRKKARLGCNLLFEYYFYTPSIL